MPEAILDSTEDLVLSALDPSLSRIASLAAIELDNLLLGKNSGLEAVQVLGQRLNKLTEPVEGTDERKSLMDAPTVSILSNAFSASRSQDVQTLAELTREAWQMASDLESTDPEQDRQALERCRAFCVFLSQNARSYRQAIYDMQAELPCRS
jgi:hypothetical protein